MDKLKILDFDNCRFEKELASKYFYINTKYGKCKIALKCVVKPMRNDVQYYVLLAQYMDYKVERFTSLKDAIVYYNNKLEEIEGEKYET